jgi:hypothetical protein
MKEGETKKGLSDTELIEKYEKGKIDLKKASKPMLKNPNKTTKIEPKKEIKD